MGVTLPSISDKVTRPANGSAMSNRQPKGTLAIESAAPEGSESVFTTGDVDKVRGSRVFGEDVFHAMLALERRRAERSGQPFVLMLLDAHQRNGSSKKILRQVVGVVAGSARETDLMGWYKKGPSLASSSPKWQRAPARH